ncbi:6960_t:CDS:10 [Acaulospora morrowiae]|uniref:6960_t:CDS:1 n=1 Tax=Acaulospora morrowiae TaxID=94023 RepID=A0A9N8W105_9GLOM|nr:6960_t:CDS:10 [Acaulospora morrowiae]
MRFTSLFTISFIFSVVFVISVSDQAFALSCRDHYYPFDHKSSKKITCDVTKNKGFDQLKSNATTLSPDQAFVIDFHCGVNNATLCNKAKNAFISVGIRIASVVNFNTPLRVNATFTNFCTDLGECPTPGGGLILGSASPARTLPLQDDDGVTRYYPQALVKQMNLENHPAFGPYDITAFFNTQANMFFKGDPDIGPDQFDFEYIVTHEFVHGLGFASSWRSYLTDTPVILTPLPDFLNDAESLNSPATFTGFSELAFDRYMQLKEPGKPAINMTTLTKQINSFVKIGTRFKTVNDLLNTFANSPQFNLTQQLLIDAETPFTMSFVTRDSSVSLFLETKLNPFQDGSSVSHVDTQFKASSDFLMAFSAFNGTTLDDIIKKTGGKSALGPKLLKVLSTLGYSTSNDPNPYQPTAPGNNQTNPSISSSSGKRTTQKRPVTRFIDEKFVLIVVTLKGRTEKLTFGLENKFQACKYLGPFNERKRTISLTRGILSYRFLLHLSCTDPQYPVISFFGHKLYRTSLELGTETRQDEQLIWRSGFRKKVIQRKYVNTRMLEDDSYSEVVSWGVNGDSFVVKEIDTFTKKILPRHFKHSNFASFVRQLNKYDFHKVRNSDDTVAPYGEQAWEFHHPKFHCDKRNQLDDIKRKTPNRRGVPASPPTEVPIHFHITELQSQINHLTRLQANMDNHLHSLSDNYNSIVQELSSFQKSMAAQDQLMQNLVQYLVSLEEKNCLSRDTINNQGNKSSDSKCISFAPSEQAQKLINSYTEISRTSFEQINKISSRAQSIHQLASNAVEGNAKTPETVKISLLETPIDYNGCSSSNSKDNRNVGRSNIIRSTFIPNWTVPPKVLLVDDDAVYQNIGSKLLKVFGCSIDIATDGLSAVGKMNIEKYDLVLMDIVLPNLDGVEATAQIRRFDLNTPIISMTSNTTAQECIKYLSNGMNDILAKPFTKTKLLSVLERYCMHLKIMPTFQNIQRPFGISNRQLETTASSDGSNGGDGNGDDGNNWISNRTPVSTSDGRSYVVSGENYIHIMNATYGVTRYAEENVSNDGPRKKQKFEWIE